MKLKRGQLLTSADAKEYKRQHQAPCSDCPWARKSLKGWTGPNSSTLWLGTARDFWFRIICHTRRKSGLVDHWECAGAAIFRSNTNVHPYPEKPFLQLPPDRITVFASPQEFINHHGEGTPHAF